MIPVTVEDRRIAALAAVAIALQVLEAAIPSPIPGVKPGLANIVTLVALLLLGWRAALALTLVRIFAASLLLGTFLSPAFWLSLMGGIAALLVLWPLRPLYPHRLSALGLAIPAALAHVAGQFLFAWSLIIPHPQLPWLLPPLLLSALATGVVTGLLATSVLTDPRLRRPED